MANYGLSLMLFRRDLRLQDNTALNAALSQSRQVLPLFIFDPKQLEPHPYFSAPALFFMLESLEELTQHLRSFNSDLHLFKGSPATVLNQLRDSCSFDALFFNRDYTPFSRQRDETLCQLADKWKLPCHIYGDSLLVEPEEIANAQGNPYRVFTPFYKRAKTLKVAPSAQLFGENFTKLNVGDSSLMSQLKTQTKSVPRPFFQGSRTQALSRLHACTSLTDYDKDRDFPARQTSGLSAHLKFGTLSARELYHAIVRAFGADHHIIKELYWRDFFTHVGHHFPHVFTGAFHAKYDAISWREETHTFAHWCAGQTGFPIVDAGMRQLNQTGYMHNRVRMITASFLVKDLFIHWRWGEAYFASRLIDFDPCVNNGNWQWAASTGCDAQPYFRIFNPWAQQSKFDPEAEYIKAWVPELHSLSATQIHRLHALDLGEAYRKPMLDHKLASGSVREAYRQALNSL